MIKYYNIYIYIYIIVIMLLIIHEWNQKLNLAWTTLKDDCKDDYKYLKLCAS